ncbi:hypothetical protein B0H14DRAFT_2698507, partial [Mycena olivaceomarginata]
MHSVQRPTMSWWFAHLRTAANLQGLALALAPLQPTPTLALACCHRLTLPSPSPAATDPLGQTPTLAASRAATE